MVAFAIVCSVRELAVEIVHVAMPAALEAARDAPPKCERPVAAKRLHETHRGTAEGHLGYEAGVRPGRRPRQFVGAALPAFAAALSLGGIALARE
jgi:hypothetical protein